MIPFSTLMRLKKCAETLKNALQTIIIVKTMNFLLMKINSVILITSLPESERMRSRDRDINSILRNTVTDGELVSFKFFCGGLRNLGKCEVFSRPSGI